jgi:hypothetical protein
MSPFVYSLCHKPFLGLAMMAASLCEFPPLVKDAPVKLDEAGSVVTVDVDVPVDLSYTLLVEMSNPGGASLNKDEITILGDRRLEDCPSMVDLAKVPRKERAAYGRAMPFKVEVRRKSDNMLVHSRSVTTMCVASKWANQRSRSLGNIALVRGSYTLRVENVAAQAGLQRLHATMLLAPGAEKSLTAQR